MDLQDGCVYSSMSWHYFLTAYVILSETNSSLQPVGLIWRQKKFDLERVKTLACVTQTGNKGQLFFFLLEDTGCLSDSLKHFPQCKEKLLHWLTFFLFVTVILVC